MTAIREIVHRQFSLMKVSGMDEIRCHPQLYIRYSKLSLTGGYIYYNLKYAQDTEEFSSPLLMI